MWIKWDLKMGAQQSTGGHGEHSSAPAPSTPAPLASTHRASLDALSRPSFPPGPGSMSALLTSTLRFPFVPSPFLCLLPHAHLP